MKGALAAAAVLFAAAFAQPASAARYTVLSAGEPVGHLVAEQAGDQVLIEYHVDNNGRGPKWRESLRLDASGRLPVAWSVEGAGGVGAPVRESYAWDRGEASWRTLNDEGRASAAAPPLYVASDASPWALGLYARALMTAPGGRLEALPAGELRIERLGELTLGTGRRAREVVAHALWGLGVTPEFVLLDPSGSLVARLGAFETVVLDELVGAADYGALLSELSGDYLQRFAERLRHRFDEPLYVTNARVFDSRTGAVSEPRTVSVFRGRIGSVRAGSPPPEAVTVIDAEGGLLLPGLFDAHVHLTSGWSGLLHIAAGVTSVRDAGNDNASLLSLRDAIDSGAVIGPRVAAAGFIEGRSPFSARNGFVEDRLEAALERVRWYADRGFQAIKIYNSVPPAWVRPLAEEAHRLGLGVMGHVPAFMSAEQAILDGYDEINHVNQLVLGFIIDSSREDTRTPFRFTALGERAGSLDLGGDEVRRVVALMQERGVALDATIAIFQQLLLSAPGEVAPNDAGWLGHMPAAVQRQRRKSQVNRPAGQEAAYRASWEKLLALLGELHEAGIRIVPGTDNTPGFMLHSELEALALAAIPRAEVLKIATLGTARHLGVDQDRGTIEPGRAADFLLVDGDPTRDMADIRRVRMVVARGEVYFPPEIHQAMGMRPFATVPPSEGVKR